MGPEGVGCGKTISIVSGAHRIADVRADGTRGGGGRASGWQ